MTRKNFEIPSWEEIERARERLRPHVHRTPLLTSRYLGERCGARVHLKCENLQRSGSFKVRGALNACLCARESGCLSPAGVLTYSSGNHGQAVALAGRALGVPATVVVPETIPRVKRAAIEGYGARVVVSGRTSEDRRVEALRLQALSGATMIPPFDHPDIVAGQASAGLEILEDLPGTDAVLVPVGGGGLLAGIALAAAHLGAGRIRVIGVEPRTANAMHLSLERGSRTALSTPPVTIADGLCPMAPGELTFAVASRHVERVLLVEDASILTAQEVLLERAKLLVEPSGAAGVAALLDSGEFFRGLSVAVVLSGGNAEVRAFAANPPPEAATVAVGLGAPGLLRP
jgi:threonine dehydratase